MRGKRNIPFIVLKIVLASIVILFISITVSRKTEAVVVSNIEIIPSNPSYNFEFQCNLSIDVDEPKLSCGLMPVGQNPQYPLDICPKRDGLGHQKTENGKRYYKCIANSSTGVSGPGTYRIVAWRFYGDGETGEVIAERNVTFSSAPPPSATPIPTSTPIPQENPTIPPTQPTVPAQSPSNTPQPFRPGYIPDIRIPTTSTQNPFSQSSSSPTPVQNGASTPFIYPGINLSMPKLRLPSIPSLSNFYVVQRSIEIASGATTGISKLGKTILSNFFFEAGF